MSESTCHIFNVVNTYRLLEDTQCLLFLSSLGYSSALEIIHFQIYINVYIGSNYLKSKLYY